MTPAARAGRPLTLWDLIFFGIVLIQPIAPIPPYGVAQQLSRGHFATILLLAMVAMIITAVSYGRMAAVHPVAGSAYTYVSKSLNVHLGFLVGWAMFLDYLLQPVINTVFVSQELTARYLPRVPFAAWAALIAIVLTLLNLRGIRTSARANKTLFFVMIAAVAAFFVLAVRYLPQHGGLLSSKPFYDPKTFSWPALWTATSFGALTYIGFDGITTLSEDAKNPARNVLLATVLVCAFTGVAGGLEVYLGSLVWPDWHAFKDVTTAFMDIAGRAGGPWLFNAFGIVLIVAAFGSALTGALAAAKLLFGMGRDGVLPRRLFAQLARDGRTPAYNLVLIGVLAFGGAAVLDLSGKAYEYAGYLLNFGAFLAFMGVNAAAFVHFTFAAPPDHKRNVLRDAVLPLAGFAFCAAIWWNLGPVAKIAGGIWLAAGVIYLAIKTRGFRAAPAAMDFS